MITLGKKVCLYNANNNHELQLDECGLSLSLPDGLFSPVDSTVYEAAAQGLWGGDFSFPAGTHLISSVCYVSLSPSVPQLDKPVTVQLVHCAHLTSQSQSQYLSFVVAQVQPGKQSGPFKFELVPGGSFSPNSQIGSIELKSFSLVAIVMSAVTIGGVAAGLAAGVAAGPLTAVAAVGVATSLALNVFTNGKYYNIDDVLNHMCIAPSFYCRALFYKNPLHDKVMMSLAVIQDLPSSNEVLSTFINSYCTHYFNH